MPASIHSAEIEAALNWRGFRLYQEPHYHEPPPIHHHELPGPPPPHELPPPEVDGTRRRNLWIAFGLGFGLLGLMAYEEED